MSTFTPQYLKELRDVKRKTLDLEEVERIKAKILLSNSKGRQNVNIALRLDTSWELLIKHFEALGFWVGRAGYITHQFDDDNNEVYIFTFSWCIGAEDQ